MGESIKKDEEQEKLKKIAKEALREEMRKLDVLSRVL